MSSSASSLDFHFAFHDVTVAKTGLRDAVVVTLSCIKRGENFAVKTVGIELKNFCLKEVHVAPQGGSSWIGSWPDTQMKQSKDSIRDAGRLGQ
jgi:hypothetical protein